MIPFSNRQPLTSSQHETTHDRSFFFFCQVFTLDHDDGLYECYSPHASDLDMETVSRQLLTVCETLNERPIVRCAADADPRVQDLSARLQQQIDSSLALRDHKARA